MAQKAKVENSVSIKERSGKKKRKKAKVPVFLRAASTAVRTEFADTVDLPTFRQTAGVLSKADRLTLIDQAVVLLSGNYVHLPLKEAMHAVDPLQRLRLLQDQVRTTPEDQLPSDHLFHREMISIFVSVRDLHTNYILPAPYNRMTAFVPFILEDFIEDGVRRYVVTRVFRGLDEPPFGPGVELLRWNGIPIARAVEINGDRFAGSNLEARRARGIEMMTIRPLMQSLPPDEDFVLLEYRTDDGDVHELRLDWLVFSPEDGTVDGAADVPTEVATGQGIDIELDMCRRARKQLFAPKVVEAERKLARAGDDVSTRNLGLQSTMPSVLEARPVDTESGTFGYLRIRTFSVQDADGFVDEVTRLISQLPREGLIIDVRDNGGGLITAGEQLVQLFTPQAVQPEPVQLINTELNLKLCERLPFLSKWSDSIRQSIRTGAIYSRGFPITDPPDANNRGQQYHGPVVLVTDALCYSTTDIFAAGFQDQVVNGLILGVDGNTGAGGANVWTHSLLHQFFPAGESGSPYRLLPNGSGMRVAIRRTLRVGDMAGTPVEDLGVLPDLRHDMTLDDVLRSNIDLIERAGEILSEMPVCIFDAELVNDASLGLRMTVRGVDRVDIFVDGRAVGSVDVSDGDVELDLGVSSADVIEVRGFSDDTLVATRRIDT